MNKLKLVTLLISLFSCSSNQISSKKVIETIQKSKLAGSWSFHGILGRSSERPIESRSRLYISNNGKISYILHGEDKDLCNNSFLKIDIFSKCEGSENSSVEL